MTVPVRWKLGEPREGRITGPLSDGHPLEQHPCLVCGFYLGGREVRLLILGPDQDDPVNVLRAREGEWHNAVALALHADCLDPRHGR